MPFEIEANRIVERDCALVRVGSPAANAAANAPGNARTAAASPSAPPAAGGLPQVAAVAPSPPPSTLSRPSPEVCRNTLIDQLGKVGVNQVRAMSDVRFKEAAIEGKVPNTNNLRIDLRGSASARASRRRCTTSAPTKCTVDTYVWTYAGPAPAHLPGTHHPLRAFTRCRRCSRRGACMPTLPWAG
jgi:hypothetical protein